MKKVEINNEEIFLVNITGNLYIINNHFSYMNISSAAEKFENNTVISPFHKAQFDIISDKKLRMLSFLKLFLL
ncbi:MAG: Rieske (2Fe-2S) protein [Promethearchaeota archaeon]